MNILSPLPFMRPAPGTSAYEFFHDKGSLAQNVVSNSLNFGLKSGLLDLAAEYSKSSPGRSKSKSGGSPGGPSVVVPPAVASSQPETFDYLDAPWASAYQMSRETAYSEALNNTAYQRAVKDMMKAGLNPAVIFGAGNGNTAGVPAFASSVSHSSLPNVRSSGSSYRRSKSSDGLVSSSAYSVISLLGGIVGAAATGNAGGYWIGSSVAQGAMNALSLLKKASKKR